MSNKESKNEMFKYKNEWIIKIMKIWLNMFVVLEIKK